MATNVGLNANDRRHVGSAFDNNNMWAQSLVRIQSLSSVGFGVCYACQAGKAGLRRPIATRTRDTQKRISTATAGKRQRLRQRLDSNG